MALIFILKENVLTDNLLHIPREGKVFKGNYIAIIEEYTFLNAWNDKRSVKRFRKQDKLDSYLSKNYPEFTY
jgi:hypothetical protein